MSIKQPRYVQLRVLLEASWISELDSLAKSRFLSRLGLIRFYLRSKMDEELTNLEEFFQAQETRRGTKSKLDAYLKDREL